MILDSIFSFSFPKNHEVSFNLMNLDSVDYSFIKTNCRYYRCRRISRLNHHAVVFDLFHTIVDSEDFRPKDFRRAERAAELLGVEVEEFSTYWSGISSIRNTDHSMTAISLIERFLARKGIRCDRDLLVKADHELGRFQDMALLNPRKEVVSALRTMRDHGLKLGLLTNCDERDVRQWPNSPVAPFFHSVCFSFDIGVMKPTLRAYETVLERLGETSREAVYVGEGVATSLMEPRRLALR